jgi:hypothetical protein
MFLNNRSFAQSILLFAQCILSPKMEQCSTPRERSYDMEHGQSPNSGARSCALRLGGNGMAFGSGRTGFADLPNGVIQFSETPRRLMRRRRSP